MNPFKADPVKGFTHGEYKAWRAQQSANTVLDRQLRTQQAVRKYIGRLNTGWK